MWCSWEGRSSGGAERQPWKMNGDATCLLFPLYLAFDSQPRFVVMISSCKCVEEVRAEVPGQNSR